MYSELIIGFFFILILSDSHQLSLSFATDIKNLYITLLGLFLLFDTKEFNPFDKLYQKFIPFFLIALLCLINSETFLVGLEKTLSYLLLLIIVPNYILSSYRKDGESFLISLIWLGTFILLTGFVLIFINRDIVYLKDRYCGILGNPNGLGIFTFMFFLVVSVISNYYPNLFERKENIIIYSSIILSIIQCGSRTALIAILIFLFFKYFYKISPFLGFILFLIILIAYQLITDNIEYIIISLGLQKYFRLDTLESGSGRIIAWTFAWEQIQPHFFFGKGFHYTDYLFKKNYTTLSMMGHQGNAHNSYLTFWLDTGLVGLVLYMRGFLLSFFKAAKKTIIAIPIMYAVLFSVFFESWLSASLNPFTIQLIIILTLITSDEFNKKIEEGTLPIH